MRTEIVIPFAFDTTPLERRLQEHGEEEVDRLIQKYVLDNIVSCIPKKMRYSWEASSEEPDWKKYLEGVVRSYLDAYEQEIIDEAALLMAMRAGSKKRWREVLEDLRAERGAEPCPEG